MMRKLSAILVCLALLLFLPVTARADIGPKPSVQITFTGIQGQTYYGTLLSQRNSTGPASAWDGREAYPDWKPDGEEDIWQKFITYQDSDGYFFLQEWWNCSETNQLNWTYYPPSPFKILLYFPETDSFYVSPIYERYAFDSYYTVDLSDYTADGISARESYDYTWELISLGARILLTILLELLIALPFGYREKKVLGFLAIVNIITQILLNVALNLINYHSGTMGFILAYIGLEILVIIVEAVIYRHALPKLSVQPQSAGKAVWYALAANIQSFVVGFWLARWISGIF